MGGQCGRLPDCVAGQEETKDCIDRARCSCDEEKVCASPACKCKMKTCNKMCKLGHQSGVYDPWEGWGQAVAARSQTY